VSISFGAGGPMLRRMAEDTSSRMHCCDSQMLQLASAERREGGDRVTVYRCATCGRVDSLGVASSPWWVGARARSFVELREEAFDRAGLEASPAVAVLDCATLEVIFG
jgi:hypothetical protein